MEFGLDELKNPIQGNYTSTTPPATTTTIDDYSPANTTIPQNPQLIMTTTPEVSLEDLEDTIATPVVTMEQDDNLKRTKQQIEDVVM